MTKDAKTDPLEQSMAFERARGLVERLNPVLSHANTYDGAFALQLLLAKFAVAEGFTAEQMINVFARNLPELMQIWEKANADNEVAFAKSSILNRNPKGGN